MSGILQTSALSILGVTFQEDCRFTANVRNKLIKDLYLDHEGKRIILQQK